MIRSEIHRGLIYAGDTPLASTIAVEQTGPMQLTVRAGSFTTTGQSRIMDANRVPDLAALIAAGDAEMLPDGERVRGWLKNSNGSFVEKSQTFALAANQVLAVKSDPDYRTLYRAELGVTVNGKFDILFQSRRDDGIEEYAEAPAGWKKVHDLIYEFVVPPKTANLNNIDIYVLKVLPGFPPGTEAKDWQTQTGSA